LDVVPLPAILISTITPCQTEWNWKKACEKSEWVSKNKEERQQAP